MQKITTQKRLIKHLKETGVLASESIERALLKVDRKKFVRDDLKSSAYQDVALSTFQGQTISQPTTVVFMLELLGAQKGEVVLDIGAGSGWVSCLLASIVGKEGRVDAFEIDPVVGGFGSVNVAQSDCENVYYQVKDAKLLWGLKKNFYAKIYVGAALGNISTRLLEMLTVGGVLVAPMQGGFLARVIRRSKDEFIIENYPGFVFVPFIER